MAKLTLTDLANLTNEQSAITAINANNTLIEDAVENSISRDGSSPNQMDASLDMNSHRILNLPSPDTATQPLRLEDLQDFVGGTLTLTESVVSFESNAAATSATIPSSNTFLRTAGYYASGDGGGALYKKVVGMPTTIGRIHSADGAWWEIAEKALRPEMFGADGTATLDTAAIQACAELGRPIIYGPRVYLLEEVNRGGALHPIRIVTNIPQRWIGVIGATFLKTSATSAWDPIFLSGITGVHISGISFDGDDKLTLTPAHYPGYMGNIQLSECNDVVIENCEFKGFKYVGLFGNVLVRYTFRGNRITRSTADSSINNGIAVAGTSSYGNIENNILVNCNIGTNGNNNAIINNHVTNWGFSAGINNQFDDEHQVIIGNVLNGNNRSTPDASPYDMAGIENWANNSIIANNVCYGCCGNGIDNGGANTIIKGNHCYDNGNSGVGLHAGIFLLGPDLTHRATGSIVTGNICNDVNTTTQDYGYTEQAGSNLVGVHVGDNIFSNSFATLDIPSGSGTQHSVGPWSNDSAVIASSGGTFTSASATVMWRRLSYKLASVQVRVIVTTLGTGSGAALVTLPFTTSTDAVFSGYDLTTGLGAAGIAAGGGTTLLIKLVDNTIPGSGSNLFVSGIVEV